MSILSIAAVGFVALSSVAIHLYVGVGFWRLHRDDLTRLSVYILTHQPGLIANFAESRPRALRRMNALALDALSFQRLLKIFLGWPVYLFHYREVLEFARFSSRVLGDEKTDALVDRLEGMGFPRADVDDLKHGSRFKDGFLVRRLDEDLVAVFWHEAVDGEGGRGRKVVPFRVPAERRVQALAQTLQKRGEYAQVMEGRARTSEGKALPYVVVFEPFSFGPTPRLRSVLGLFLSDVRRLRDRVLGHPFESFEDAFGGEEDSLARRAEQAYRRFIVSTQRS